MTITTDDAAWFADSFGKLTDNVGQALLGKAPVIRLALTCMLAEGHLLLEDAPGTGKTAMARAIAATVQGSHSRIQFTPDLLPSDITGTTIYDQASSRWEFHKGPIFASIVLADEINRASPKTQSALLEVMEEGHVTVDGTSYDAGRPFMVIATQNPIEQAGTYRLPEAQLDRFLMKTSVGYPDRAAAVQVLAGSAAPDRTRTLSPMISTQAVAEMADLVKVEPRRRRGARLRAAAHRGHPRRLRHHARRLDARRDRHGPGRARLGGGPWSQLRAARRHQGARAAPCGATDW